jgi:hypothetical protein
MITETIATCAPSACSVCGMELSNKVLSSTAGFYIGTRCECGPHSRESGYFRTRPLAEHALTTGDFHR